MSKCTENGCDKRASYNLNCVKTPLYCSMHKKEDMVNVVTKRCIIKECNTRPCYNLPEEKSGIYCLKHKSDEMINVMTKSCLFEGCDTQANFNLPGETKGIYCLKHKLYNMINVASKKCIFEGCMKHALFNMPGVSPPLYCSKHKVDKRMINNSHPTCLEDGCKLNPFFNYLNLKKGIYCSKHKLVNMVDVINKKCIFEGCTKSANFNISTEKRALYCKMHKDIDMVNVKDRVCIYEGCKNKSRFNLSTEKTPLYCNNHKLINMVNIKTKKCKTPLCMILANKKYRGYCFSCFVHTFPDEPNSRNYKTKEKYTTDYIKEKIPNVDWVVDRKVYDGCSRRRPDLYLDLGYQVLVVEIDENQHTKYDCSCENKRLMEISQDIGHRPLIFIRFNPDDYILGENKITSCWSLDGNGICTVKKSKKKEWVERLIKLENQIRYWLDPENKTDKTVEVVQLYYDQ
jgi:hypothetical protein